MPILLFLYFTKLLTFNNSFCVCFSKGTTDTDYQRCWRKFKRRLFLKKVKTVCEKLTTSLKSSHGEFIQL